MTSYSGYIVASPAPEDFTAEKFERPIKEVAHAPTLTRVSPRVFNVNRWDEYRLKVSIPLADEPREQEEYQYLVYVVRGFAKVILLAPRRRIVDYVIGQILDRQIYPNLRKVSIFIDPMINYCRQSEAEFLVTSLHGRFAGSATQLRSISLYGDDVTQSPLYIEHHQFFNFHSAGLGRRLVDGLPRVPTVEEREIVRISSDGFVNLNLTTRLHAREFLQVINFVMANRWVEDWVPSGKGGMPWQT